MIDALKPRWFRLTPGRLVLPLLVIEGLLWLSERSHWFALNHHKGWTVLIAVASVGLASVLMLVWFAVNLLFRRQFQFSIRSLLVLTVAIVIPCSWLAMEMKKAKQQHDAGEAVTKLHGRVTYDYDFDSRPPSVAEPRGPFWLRKLFGDDFFNNAAVVELSDDAQMEHLKGLSQLRGLLLHGTKITDVGLQHLEGMTQLRWLYLSDTKITDAGMQHLEGLAHLRTLWFDCTNTEVTDAGLQHLKGLTQLQELWLNGMKITDGGLRHLEGMTQLQSLWFDHATITGEGVKKLQQVLPNCYIRH